LGYSFPGWFDDAGFQSSAGAFVWAKPRVPASKDSNPETTTRTFKEDGM
jgi:hypothetical protein